MGTRYVGGGIRRGRGNWAGGGGAFRGGGHGDPVGLSGRHASCSYVRRVPGCAPSRPPPPGPVPGGGGAVSPDLISDMTGRFAGERVTR